MRKLILFIICTLFVFSAAAVYAAPVGNIATPSLLKKGIIYQDGDMDFTVTAAAEIDLTWDQKFKNQSDSTEYYFFGIKTGVLIAERFMPYAMLGGAQANKQQFKIGANKVRWDTNYDYVWGIGCTAMLYEKEINEMGGGILRIGIDGRYRQSHLDVNKIKLNDNDALKASDPSVQQAKYELKQWQVALGIAYQLDQAVPYVGVKFANSAGKAAATIGSENFVNKFDNKSNVGIFVGSDFVINDSLTINIEGRFLDETALSMGAATRF
jgi:hypothetical protein